MKKIRFCTCPVKELYSMGLVRASSNYDEVFTSEKSRCPMCGALYKIVVSLEDVM